jgi:hypothetical protein
MYAEPESGFEGGQQLPRVMAVHTKLYCFYYYRFSIIAGHCNLKAPTQLAAAN